jgi:hypothetical protein
MSIGKNARKRLARVAFNSSDTTSNNVPYCLHVIEYRDGTRRHIKFISLTAFKEYRERFYSSGVTGSLSLVSDLDTLDDSRGKPNRARIINKGIGINTDKAETPSFTDKRPKRYAIDGFR